MGRGKSKKPRLKKFMVNIPQEQYDLVKAFTEARTTPEGKRFSHSRFIRSAIDMYITACTLIDNKENVVTLATEQVAP